MLLMVTSSCNKEDICCITRGLINLLHYVIYKKHFVEAMAAPYNGVKIVFLANFGPFWFGTWVLLNVRLACLGKDNMSESSNHLQLISWTWIHNSQMISTVAKSEFNRHLWDVVGQKSHTTNVQLANLHQLCDANHVNMDQNQGEMFSAACLICAMKNSGSSEYKSGFNLN